MAEGLLVVCVWIQSESSLPVTCVGVPQPTPGKALSTLAKPIRKRPHVQPLRTSTPNPMSNSCRHLPSMDNSHQPPSCGAVVWRAIACVTG